MGLVTKNAILLVDFAVQLRERGLSMGEALEQAGATRLRPILMTTAAMIFGMMPVAIGHGDGGETRAPMGITVIGGLVTSTFLTLVVVPVVYTFMESVSRFFGRFVSRFSSAETEEPAAKPAKALEPSAGE
jgi:multidrug efflux pump subunit AcrB